MMYIMLPPPILFVLSGLIPGMETGNGPVRPYETLVSSLSLYGNIVSSLNCYPINILDKIIVFS